jgi:hypothetical protein
MGTRRNLSRIRDGQCRPVPIFFLLKKTTPLISGTNKLASSVVEHSSRHSKVEGSIPGDNDDRGREHEVCLFVFPQVSCICKNSLDLYHKTFYSRKCVNALISHCFYQGILTEGEGLVQLCINSFRSAAFNTETYVSFLQNKLS